MPRDYFKATLEYRLLQEHGERLPEILRDLYITQKLPIREAMDALGVNALTPFRKLLEKYGVPVRRGSEAIANQWARKPERRASRGVQQFTRMVRARAAVGEHWARGQTKATHPGLESISKKLSESGRLQTRSAIERATNTRKRLHRADPSTHTQASAKPTTAEQALLDWLTKTGRRAVFQHPVQVGEKLLFVDFYLPECNVALEVTKTIERFGIERVRTIVASGIVPVGIPNGAVLRGNFAKLDEAITRAERGKFNPSTLRECWMSLRTDNIRAAHAADLDKPIR